MQKKGWKGKDKELIIMETYAKQHITSHHWISASTTVHMQERLEGAPPLLAKIVPILIILIVIAMKE